jgi:hypothetical protein
VLLGQPLEHLFPLSEYRLRLRDGAEQLAHTLSFQCNAIVSRESNDLKGLNLSKLAPTHAGEEVDIRHSHKFRDGL